MRLDDQSRWTISPTDLATFTRCEHAVQLRRGMRLGTLRPLAPLGKSTRADMLARRGEQHEDAWLKKLHSDGKRVVEIDRARDDATVQTVDAMRDGADVIYQAALRSEPEGDGFAWFGYADFLERVETPSSLGSWSYEVADTKLSMSVHPWFILQLGVYSTIVERLQRRPADQMHLILGDESRQSFRIADFAAYLNHLRARFAHAMADGHETLPYPVDYCALCEWNAHCWRHLLQLDHLTLVANIRRDHVEELESAGVATLTALGRRDPAAPPDGMSAPVFERLAHQARLQLRARETKEHSYEFLLPVEERRGFQLLPPPSPGDLFFDVEADPFEDLTYLFGITYLEEGSPRYLSFWAHDAAEERQAFESAVDFMLTRRREHPGAHIYHYAPAEPTTLKKLMGRYGSREEEIDGLLRADAFVDLAAVVRQAIRISHPSYSLKKVETFYMERSSEGVIEAGGAIAAYEQWLETREPERLREIEAYNREDCDSTWQLREWLLRLRRELEAREGIELAWREPKPPQPTSEEVERERAEADELSGGLLRDLPEDRLFWSDTDQARWRLAHLLHYHRRDAKPAWWEFLSRREMTEEELLENRESIAGLEPTGRTRPVRRSIATEFRFPPQIHKLETGAQVYDPGRLDEAGFPVPAGSIETIDDEEGVLELCRSTGFEAGQLPRAVTLNEIVSNPKQRESLRRLARLILASPDALATARDARVDLLLRRPPRIHGRGPGSPLQGIHVGVELAKELARGLDGSYLFIQGPPGSGKTYVGARVIVDLLAHGRRVGVSASSHKAIENLLHEIEKVAQETGLVFRGVKHSQREQVYASRLTTPLIVDTAAPRERGTPKPDPADPAFELVAGTPWLFSDPAHDRQFDVLVIDEAGQMSLADALAIASAARNIILLGDPLQLAQVSQGTHPEGCGASVLEHLLGSDATIPRERGLFLEQTWRMHPGVCRFISEVVYAGRLQSERDCARQNLAAEAAPVLAGTGLRYHPVDHRGNSQASAEEAEWIAERVAEGIGTVHFTERSGAVRPLAEGDVLIVTPYNAQVAALRHALDARGLAGVRAGTVDKFQGQQAPVVFFSMATSSGDDIPRSLDFLFSRNRLNVAISRAQCLAILVASPKLLDVHCATVEQMKLVNALCTFVQMAREV